MKTSETPVLVMESVSFDVVKKLLSEGRSYDAELLQTYPHITRDLSTRSVRRYVKAKGLKQQVKDEVFDAVKDSVTDWLRTRYLEVHFSVQCS